METFSFKIQPTVTFSLSSVTGIINHWSLNSRGHVCLWRGAGRRETGQKGGGRCTGGGRRGGGKQDPQGDQSGRNRGKLCNIAHYFTIEKAQNGGPTNMGRKLGLSFFVHCDVVHLKSSFAQAMSVLCLTFVLVSLYSMDETSWKIIGLQTEKLAYPVVLVGPSGLSCFPLLFLWAETVPPPRHACSVFAH